MPEGHDTQTNMNHASNMNNPYKQELPCPFRPGITHDPMLPQMSPDEPLIQPHTPMPIIPTPQGDWSTLADPIFTIQVPENEEKNTKKRRQSNNNSATKKRARLISRCTHASVQEPETQEEVLPRAGALGSAMECYSDSLQLSINNGGDRVGTSSELTLDDPSELGKMQMEKTGNGRCESLSVEQLLQKRARVGTELDSGSPAA